MEKFTLHPKVKLVYKTEGKHHFFGYHDVSPWSEDGSLLTHEVDFIERPPKKNDIAGICIIDTTTWKLQRITDTQMWNFQQGARLQWIPGGENKIIYNY